MKKETIVTHSAEETLEFFREIGRQAKKGDVFALHGNLGAGKTIIAKGIALGMGIEDDITSPTFTLLESYEGPLPLHHFDLYRIERDDEFDNLFFEEYWEGDGVAVIEWAGNAGNRLPENSHRIFIDYIDENTRSITIEYPDL
ncbi:MAG: tRNA (adenosine(37)-N6)-threonylcarbamoyltransferase complex ATPase subunit type 1 TsaE [Spirochaetae bacterium HGW-Spirochaetae-1]|jgi:tRNA threonylcarbamoyladenosine biosynthesis protein TsaE|nr:MAG: tRNA (adenosine(37)-N6)-threonylcarbamoyltransferase complex ATPase subunit type 1 TsaE [Spirochaetae bacterium HGW-Spirochaetae-1]